MLRKGLRKMYNRLWWTADDEKGFYRKLFFWGGIRLEKDGDYSFKYLM